MQNEQDALKVAECLLRIKAVELKPDQPFTWASGLKSPIYCDNRKTLSFPEIRNFIRDQFVKVISNEYQNPEVIAGVATGGIAIGALIAQALDLPFIYVRSEAKKHGLGNQIEGVLEAGQKVIVIEDLISTGNSSLNAVHALRERGAQVEGMIAIFTYGFDKAKANFIDANCKLSTLTEYDTLLKEALHSNYISPDQLQALQSWRKNPEAWSASFQTSLS